MFKTLKWKFAAVYIVLVVIISIIGVYSTVNNYNLSKLIDGLMVHNYKSIKAINDMSKSLEEQNASMLTYINMSHEDGINNFHLYESSFNQNYNIEANNITETGEQDLVDQLNSSYTEYLKLFSKLQEASSKNDINSSSKFYNENILPEFNHLKQLLTSLSSLNEGHMFDSKDKVTDYAKKSMYVILVLSASSVIIGFLISMLSLVRFLRPLYSLRDTMKAVKEGDLNQVAPIVSNDEIGDLTVEFNNMTKRLLQFEQSTLGQLLSEKNKSIAIVKSIADPIIVLDTSYRITLLNTACENMFNLEEKNVINRYFLEVIRNGDLYDYICSIHNCHNNKPDPKLMYINIKNKDYYFNVVVTSSKDYADNITGLVVLFQNVTQLKQIEKMKSDFTATISHEFKTPLTSIMIGTSLISDENVGTLTEKQKSIIETISDDSERLLSLVNDLLNLSKIESSESIFNMKPESMEYLIKESVKSFSEQSKTKKVYLHSEIDPKLPKVSMDAEKILWVLNNLISNALRYTDENDEIQLSCFTSQDNVCVSVRDTGIGIPEDYQEKIFDKFVQVAGQDSEMKGTGLGLAIAREIIEAHSGEIWCVSKLNEGSTFTFTLPINHKNNYNYVSY